MLRLMRRWALSDLALDRPVTIGMALCAVLLLGVIGLFSMPLSFLPTNTKPRLYVRVQIERTSPEVLEREVIRPLEEQVATVRDLERIQVGSGSWGVRLNLDFEPGTDIDARKLELRDRIERIRGDLPPFVNNVFIGAYTNFDDPMMEMQVSSGTDLSEDYYLIEERIVRKLERVSGVARVELDGVSPHELEVKVDLESVQRSGVDLADVSQAVRDARSGRSLGMLREVPLEVSAELGRTRLSVAEILQLNVGSIVELDRTAGAPVDVVVNGSLIARGEVVVIDDEYGVRITEIMGRVADSL